jgi:hypothetical protein
MMRMLIPVLLLLIGLGGGIGAGLFLGGGDEVAAEEGAHGEGETEGDDGHGAEDADSGHGEEADDGHGGGSTTGGQSVEQTGQGTEYVRLNNQFVVPIVRNGTVRSLVVLSLSIEVNTGQNGAVFDREPRLRDSFLRVLFAHANAGGFDGSFTESAAMAPLREGLRESAISVLGASVVHEVLITDITRQDA